MISHHRPYNLRPATCNHRPATCYNDCSLNYGSPSMSEAANKNDLDYENIRDLGHLAIDRLIDHLSGLRNGPAYVAVPDNERQSLLNQPLPVQGTDPLKIIDDIIAEVFRFPMGNNHPRFFGWVNSPAAPVSIIASLLAAGLNPSCAGGDHAAIYLERAVLDWIKALLGFPPGHGAARGRRQQR